MGWIHVSACRYHVADGWPHLDPSRSVHRSCGLGRADVDGTNQWRDLTLARRERGQRSCGVGKRCEWHRGCERPMAAIRGGS